MITATTKNLVRNVFRRVVIRLLYKHFHQLLASRHGAKALLNVILHLTAVARVVYFSSIATNDNVNGTTHTHVRFKGD